MTALYVVRQNVHGSPLLLRTRFATQSASLGFEAPRVNAR